MQFNVAAVLAVMASVAAASQYAPQSTVTVTECSTSLAPSGYAAPSGHAAPTHASTGVHVAPTPTGSPIPHYTGGASLNGASALGMIIAGGVALFL